MNTNSIELPPHALLTKQEVMSILRIKRTALENGVRRGYLPEPIAISDRHVMWRREAIEAVLNKESRVRYSPATAEG